MSPSNACLDGLLVLLVVIAIGLVARLHDLGLSPIAGLARLPLGSLDDIRNAGPGHMAERASTVLAVYPQFSPSTDECPRVLAQYWRMLKRVLGSVLSTDGG
jgi:hypothetical protein